MAILRVNTEEKEIVDGTPLTDAAEELGVPFGCYAGACGTCKVTVLSGAENLDELTDEEDDMGLEEGERLMCQATIVSGVVEVEPE